MFRSIFTEIDKKIVIYVKKVFSHQIEPHSAKLSFSIVFKYFYRNCQKTCHLEQKCVFLIKLSPVHQH